MRTPVVATTVALLVVCVAPSAGAVPRTHHRDGSPSYGVTWTADPAGNSLSAYAAGASGAASPIATISGASTGLDGPSSVAIGPKGGIWVANAGNDSITGYAAGATGDVAPVATISGPATDLDGPSDVVLLQRQVWVTDPAANLIEAFSTSVSGNVPPAETISGPRTQLDHPIQLIAAADFGTVTVLNAPTAGTGSITQYFLGEFGNVAPITRILGTTAHAFVSPTAIACVTFPFIWVADGGRHSVTDLISLFGGTRVPAVATLQGSATGLDAPTALAVDATGGLEVADATSHTISVFAAGAHGDVAPARTITGVGSDSGTPAGLAVTGAAPGAPTGLHVSLHGTTASLHWTAPTSTGGGVVGYDIAVGLKLKHGTETITGSSGGAGLNVPVNTTTTSYAVRHLKLGRKYFFLVQAANAFGMSSSARSAIVQPVSAPGAPTSVLAVGSANAVTVGWSKPAQDGGRPITHYRVEYATCSPGALGCSFKSRLVSGSHRRTRITGLAAGTTYDARVIAENHVGPGKPSKVVTAKTS